MTHFSLSIKKRPGFCDVITTETFRTPLRKLYDLRSFQARDENGNLLFTAKAAVVLINTESKRPQRLDKHFPDSFFVCSDQTDFSFSKLVHQDSYEFSQNLTPRFDEIDFNNHVNNTAYTNWAISTIPREYFNSHKLREIEVNFKEESFFGDQITSKLNLTNDGAGLTCNHLICRSDTDKRIGLLRTAWDK